MDSTASTPEALATPTLLFRVGEDLYGSKVTDAQEVLPLRAATRVPGAPCFVRGLVNVRGEIVTVLDLGARLDPSRAPGDTGSILLVRHHGGGHLVGIVVDEVMDVRPLLIEENAAVTAGRRGGTTRGIARADGTTAVILDLDSLISQVLLSSGGTV